LAEWLKVKAELKSQYCQNKQRNKLKIVNNNKCWSGCWGKGTSYTASGNINLYNHDENSMEAPPKTKNRTSLLSSNPLLGVYPKEFKSGYNKCTCTPLLIAALFTTAKLQKQPR
jgi:hypothetical protein